MPPRATLCLSALLACLILAACGGGQAEESKDGRSLTVYSGREEEYAGPLIRQFEQQSGIQVKVRYGDSAELAATLLEEGANSPADVFFSQDAGALGALQKAGRLAPLPPAVVSAVPPRYRSADRAWVGTSGRARIVAFNPRRVRREELPESILEFVDPRWKGRIGWAPTNSSFQSFVTALRVLEGDEAATRWLRGIKDNQAQTFEKNSAIRDAVASGEVDVGFINHYYVAEARAEKGPGYPVEIYYPRNGDAGALVNVAGVGVLEQADHPQEAEEFVRFLLSRRSQEYFARQVKEYPLVAGVPADPSLVPLSKIPQPPVDLSDLDDTQATVKLIERSGVL